MTDANSLLMGTGVPGAKFPTIGTVVKGRITAVDSGQQVDFKTKAPLFYDDGKPRMQIVVTLATDIRDPEIPNDDGVRKLYVKGQMQKAIRDAVVAAGAEGLEIGGTIAVQFTAEKPSETRGFNPSKVYVAQYARPAAGMLLAATGAAAPPATESAAATDLI